MNIEKRFYSIYCTNNKNFAVHNIYNLNNIENINFIATFLYMYVLGSPLKMYMTYI